MEVIKKAHGTSAGADKQYSMNNGHEDNGFTNTIVDEVIKEATQKTNLFLVKPANTWIDEAKCRPVPAQLYKEFWFENELCILFADSNTGKSILAVQISNNIAQSRPVIYFDFELSDKQFEARYSTDYADHYKFPDNFFRAEIDPDGDFDGFSSFEDYLTYSLEKVVTETGTKILVIDNITYLKNETDKAKNALPLMKQLKALKKKYDLSILVLAHTPKRDLSKPITQNDLQGSKMIMNFCDSAFAIGASHKDPSIRYLKQIKTRNTELMYGSENIMVHHITKRCSYLFLEFMVFGSEREHLKQITEKERNEMILKVKELEAQGKSQRDISREMSIAVSTVNKYLHTDTLCSVRAVDLRTPEQSEQNKTPRTPANTSEQP